MSFSPDAEQEAGTSAQETPIKGCLIMGGEPHQTEAERSERPELFAVVVAPLAYCYFITHNSTGRVSERVLSFPVDRQVINGMLSMTKDHRRGTYQQNRTSQTAAARDPLTRTDGLVSGWCAVGFGRSINMV